MKNFGWLLISILFANSLLSMEEAPTPQKGIGTEVADESHELLSDEQLARLQELAIALSEEMKREREEREKARKKRKVRE